VAAGRQEERLHRYYPHETKVNIGMNTGQHVYTVMYNYMLAAMNQPPSALAGQFDMVEMPGAAHGALGSPSSTA